jgi:hypothetical protein
VTAPTVTESEEDTTGSPVTGVRRSPAALLAVVMASWRRLPSLLKAPSLRNAGRSPWILGIVAALWAGAMGLVVAIVPMLITWIATPASGLTWQGASRLGALVWVVAQGTPVAIGAVTYSLLPWGLALIPVLLLGYAGGWAARRARVSTVRDAASMLVVGVLTYSALAGLVASLSAHAASSTATLEAVLHSALLSTVALGWGVIRASGLALTDVVPALTVVVVRSGLLGALSILGAGAVAAAAATLARFDDAVTMTQALHAGIWGGLALLLLGLAYLPVAIVWASSYLLGAGFLIGPSIAVSPFIPVTSPTLLPPFPLLASVPQSTSPAAWALPLVGIAAGVLVGLAVARGARKETRLTRLALALGAAAVTALIMLAVAYLADGSLGDVRLAHLGPSPTTVAVLAFALVTLGAVPSAVVPSPPSRPRLTVTHDSAAGEAVMPEPDVAPSE